MAGSIGIRVYMITLHERGDKTKLPFDTEGLASSPYSFITQFVSDHTTITQNADQERSWYFEEKEAQVEGDSRGYVHYGTFGFESDLIDTKTKAKNYRRKATDIEEIPLFYEFWCPEDSDHGFVAFQSFQGRSCIALVMKKMQDKFEIRNPGYLLKFKKLVPSDKSGSAYGSAQVKRLRLIKKNAPKDVTDRYYNHGSTSAVDVELTISARRNGSIGMLSNIKGSLKKDGAGIITQDGDIFGEAIADIRIGGKVRSVGIFGISGDAGVIELSDVIEKGTDGHPTFESMARETNEILKDFHVSLTGRASEN